MAYVSPRRGWSEAILELAGEARRARRDGPSVVVVPAEAVWPVVTDITLPITVDTRCRS